MLRFRDVAKYWLPPVLWMTLIFWGSTDALSERHTSRFLGPLLRWIIPHIREEVIVGIQVVIRKGGHITEYGILSLLFWLALARPKFKRGHVWKRAHVWGAWGLALVYASSDEFHQSFVATRDGTPKDVGFDMIGATVALFLLWAVGRRFGWWLPQSERRPAT